ncbi:hypothetical protein BS78_08G140300 [Paspalum vaginatum]|nr:hypothetical protein BS78_08G140300 [Paspalum vaginatum]
MFLNLLNSLFSLAPALPSAATFDLRLMCCPTDHTLPSADDSAARCAALLTTPWRCTPGTGTCCSQLATAKLPPDCARRVLHKNLAWFGGVVRDGESCDDKPSQGVVQMKVAVLAHLLHPRLSILARCTPRLQ